MSDIIVVGSLVVDFTVYAIICLCVKENIFIPAKLSLYLYTISIIRFSNELPHVGETVLGYRFQQSYGGKGGNKAVAASRLGSSVCFVGKVLTYCIYLKY